MENEYLHSQKDKTQHRLERKQQARYQDDPVPPSSRRIRQQTAGRSVQAAIENAFEESRRWPGLRPSRNVSVAWTSVVSRREVNQHHVWRLKDLDSKASFILDLLLQLRQ